MDSIFHMAFWIFVVCCYQNLLWHVLRSIYPVRPNFQGFLERKMELQQRSFSLVSANDVPDACSGGAPLALAYIKNRVKIEKQAFF